ncbi:TSC-22/dip/bun family protein [Cooperia oncophora]
MFYYSAVGSNNGMGQPSTSAIDSKIEQAMDLVKTHLMFAVREELDVLRGKITELESNIIRLETENAVFKANIPSDILKEFVS